jgi:hypothetical protein
MYICTINLAQETEHIRQHDGDDGKVRKQFGSARRREDRPAARGKEENW